jgi:hypothetical protein
MTGTPMDLTPFGPLLSALGIGYWLLALGAAGLALWWPKQWWIKLPLAAIVLGAFVYPALLHKQEQKTQRDESQARLDTSMALFRERCKSAGEKITRTVDRVEGVVWMKWRPTEANLSDQFRLNDPYGHDCFGDACIKRLLRLTEGAGLNPDDAKQHTKGYRFVETIDPSDGQRYRYIGVIKSIATRTAEEMAQYKSNSRGRDPGPDVYGFALKRELIANFTARYGITWDDLSTREDREHWIAGSSLKAVDLQTNEVIAERVGYLLDRALGVRAEYRSVWAQAHEMACPPITSEHRTWTFAMRVIQPTPQGE